MENKGKVRVINHALNRSIMVVPRLAFDKQWQKRTGFIPEEQDIGLPDEPIANNTTDENVVMNEEVQGDNIEIDPVIQEFDPFEIHIPKDKIKRKYKNHKDND